MKVITAIMDYGKEIPQKLKNWTTIWSNNPTSGYQKENGILSFVATWMNQVKWNKLGNKDNTAWSYIHMKS
jgi:hypothetical protein